MCEKLFFHSDKVSDVLIVTIGQYLVVLSQYGAVGLIADVTG